MEGSQSVAIGSDSGHVQVFRVESQKKVRKFPLLSSPSSVPMRDAAIPQPPQEGAPRYTNCTPKYGTRAEGSVVALSNYATQTQTLLIYATTKGKVSKPWNRLSFKVSVYAFVLIIVTISNFCRGTPEEATGTLVGPTSPKRGERDGQSASARPAAGRSK
jgi:hypothetical protein